MLRRRLSYNNFAGDTLLSPTGDCAGSNGGTGFAPATIYCLLPASYDELTGTIFQNPFDDSLGFAAHALECSSVAYDLTQRGQ